MTELCLNPFFLRVLYLSKIILNIMRFVVPIVLIFKIIIDVYKQVINPQNEDGRKKIINRVMASIVIFMVPTLVSLLTTFISFVVSYSPNESLNVCKEFSNLDYIKELEKNRTEDEIKLYLGENEQNYNSYELQAEAIRKIVESNKVSAGVGEYANNHNMIACGTGSTYNTGLFNAVRSAGYKTREGVVAAALYLSSHIDKHIPYFWSGGHLHSYKDADGALIKDYGENSIGVSNKWGCPVRMDFGGTNKQKDGVLYPFGLDCSGFVNWAILNGGYYTGGSSEHISVGTGSSVFSSIGDIRVQSVSAKNAYGKIKPGDIAFKKGHVGLVVEVKQDHYTVAEEMGYDYGLVISEISYGDRFTDIVLMDDFYSSYKSNTPLWNGFK